MLLVLSLTKCRLQFIIHYYKGSRRQLRCEGKHVVVVHGPHDRDSGSRNIMIVHLNVAEAMQWRPHAGAPVMICLHLGERFFMWYDIGHAGDCVETMGMG